ncbi:hypothetical protein BJ912DRAFT_935619 [Pholiota molesta]|nr:hypothetical protein BJ912DRAFT_935619 [Pholiota molesta]
MALIHFLTIESSGARAQHGRSCDNGMPLNLNFNLNLNFASNSTSRPSPTTYQAHESSPRRNFYPVSLIFGGSIELAPGLSICLVPLGRSLTHSLFTYNHLPTRTAWTSQLKMTTMEARRSYTPPFSLALDDDDSGRSRRSKSTEDRMNGQREAPAHSSVYTCLTMHHRQPQRVLLALQGQRNRRDIEDAAANDYDRDLPLRHP